MQTPENTIQPIMEVANSTSTGALSSNVPTALAASAIIKATPGRLYQLTGYNASASTRYVQVHNSATLPAESAIPLITFPVAAGAPYSWDLLPFGKFFSAGIVVVTSSTGPTKTIGAAELWINAEYL